MSDDEESLSDLYPRTLPEITNITKENIEPVVPEVSLLATNGYFFEERPKSPEFINHPPKPKQPKDFSSYNEWKKNFYSNRQKLQSVYSSHESTTSSLNSPKQGILKKSQISTNHIQTEQIRQKNANPSQSDFRHINPEYIRNPPQSFKENFAPEPERKEDSIVSLPNTYYQPYSPYLGMSTHPPPPPFFLDPHHHHYNPYPYHPHPPYPPYHSRNTKYFPENSTKPISPPKSIQQNPSENSLQIQDLYNLIKKQNEKLQKLEKQVELLIIKQSEQDEERRKEREFIEKKEREWKEEIERRKEEMERWRRRMIEEENFKREQWIREQEEKQKKAILDYNNKHNSPSLLNRNLSDSGGNRKFIEDKPDSDIETIDLTNPARKGRKKISIGVMTSFVEVSDSEPPKEVSLTLHGLELNTVPEPPVSPEPPVRLNLKDYPGSEESEEETANYCEPKIGWTFYNNVVGEVNKLLKSAPPPTTSVPASKTAFNPPSTVPLQNSASTKRVTFEGPSDTSLKMNALALKYLNENQLREFALLLAEDKKGSDPLNSAGVNLSQATMRYMERYHLLPPKENPLNDSKRRLLDLNTLKQQPKLL